MNKVQIISVFIYHKISNEKYKSMVKIIEPEAGPPFTSYNSSLHNAFVITVLKT